MAGSLIVVGTGIGLYGQTTLEARTHIEGADKVFYLVADPVTSSWISELNPTAESLFRFYGRDKDRLTTYLEMTEHVLAGVRSDQNVCCVFYGHPGVFVFPSHEAIIRARAEGYSARMLPAVSAEDCLFADLGIDPGRAGCQSYEATDFLVHSRKTDVTSVLVLWQIGVVGEINYGLSQTNSKIQVLTETLLMQYPSDHEVIVYQASQYPVCDPVMDRVSLSMLPNANITAISTLVVPPVSLPVPNLEMLDKLGIPSWYIKKKQDTPTRYNLLRPQPFWGEHSDSVRAQSA